MRLRRADIAALAVVGGALCVACGIAPVRWDGAPLPPSRHTYGGPHGVPRAFGGGVCPLEPAHTHSYPPVPADAYAVVDGRAVDTRAMYPYFDPHVHHGGACYDSGWHLHLEPPRTELRYSVEKDAYVEGEGEDLVVFEGKHAPLRCEPKPCTFEEPHGHRRCRRRPPKTANEKGPP